MRRDNPHDVGRLHQLLLMLSSDQPGEQLAAIAAIGRWLEANERDWHWLIDRLAAESEAPPSPGGIADLCRWLLTYAELTDWERNFLQSLQRFRRLTPKQQVVLDRLATRARGHAHA